MMNYTNSFHQWNQGGGGKHRNKNEEKKTKINTGENARSAGTES